MKINNVYDNYQLNFSAQVSKNFISASRNYCENTKQGKQVIDKFFQQIRNFKKFGYEDYTIEYKKNRVNGKTEYSLIALRYGMKDSDGMVLTKKDNFRKVFQKFLHMNKHEFIQKIEYQKNKKFAAKTWSELI